MKFPWRILILILIVLLGYTIYQRVYDPIPPILVGIFIFYLFDSMAHANVEITTGKLMVSMGALTSFSLPVKKIEKIEEVEHLFIQGLGIRACGKGEIAVIASTGKAIRLHLKSKGSLKVLHLIPVSFRKLRLALENQKQFVKTISQYKDETGRI